MTEKTQRDELIAQNVALAHDLMETTSLLRGLTEGYASAEQARAFIYKRDCYAAPESKLAPGEEQKASPPAGGEAAEVGLPEARPLTSGAYTAMGWMHAECCAALDRGEDPRKMDVAGMKSRAEEDLSEEADDAPAEGWPDLPATVHEGLNSVRTAFQTLNGLLAHARETERRVEELSSALAKWKVQSDDRLAKLEEGE